ncbi:DUF192 domain-containing protein [Fictibacillus sp. b24]|uniref:DUF192 domain-containing protein n=1 Tax=Fictibacillus sp. b24 TaxID=3055863 RepID=UPI0025A27213|nr:DUF192 domain-containing protein [Fictibacillus sp. b24]MDM5314859.1 DUF192 domain-containing protein [Fictibacillus sp. b24]
MVHFKEQYFYRKISYSVHEANTFFSRLKGLMFKKTLLDNEALWIRPCNSIHMCFMFFPIDVIFLDQNKQIVKLVSNLQPWKFIRPVKNAYSVLELPVNTIERSNLKVGEYLEF